jgi:hypothetical protein
MDVGPNFKAPLSRHEIAVLRRLKSEPRHQASSSRWQLLVSMGLTAVRGGPRDLATVLDGLSESKIAVHADITSRIDLRIGQRAGSKDQASFALTNEQGAARWLHRTAIKLFPASKYAWKHSSKFSPVAFLARRWSPF